MVVYTVSVWALGVVNGGLYSYAVGCRNEEGAAVMQPLLYKDDLISRDYFFQA